MYAKPVVQRTLDLMGDADMAAHGDSLGGICTDYMMIRHTQGSIDFWNRVLDIACPATFGEQGACNQVIKEGGVKCVILPMEEFYNCCACSRLHGGTLPGWIPTRDEIPSTARIVHAACVHLPEKWNVLCEIQRHLGLG